MEFPLSHFNVLIQGLSEYKANKIGQGKYDLGRNLTFYKGAKLHGTMPMKDPAKSLRID